MTLEEYIQLTLQNIQEIKTLVGDNIFAFVATTNSAKCFIRWNIISEEPAVEQLTFSNFKKAEVQISIFSNTILNARTIANAVERAFNDNKTNSNIRCSRVTTTSPIAEDKHTIHYPMRLTFFYNNI